MEESPVLLPLLQEPFSIEQSQESYRCPLTNGDDSSIKSWSPETYNGSISAEEEEAEYRLVQNSLSKSYDSTLQTTPQEEEITSSSYPVNHHEVRRKSFKAWISHKIKKKQKLEIQLNNDVPEKEVHRVGSYKQVGHITAKYEKISKERRMKEALEAKEKMEQPSSDSPLLNNVPSGVEEFISLPLYAQMKYKLGIILSNIHIPTASFQSPLATITTNARRDLVMLLEESLCRNLWIADSSESGVIRELLNRINELDEEWLVILIIFVMLIVYMYM